jgi:glycerol-3-phosphate dehydrogenase (NAD(P)+)
MPEIGKTVGVVGAGSFGSAIGNLLARNVEVLLYSRQPEVVEIINSRHQISGVNLSPRIRATSHIEEVADECRLIIPVVPSASFRDVMRRMGPHLRPYHVLIHATKGFDVSDAGSPGEIEGMLLTRENVCTMSEVIVQESAVVRVGCLSGPNLASEIQEGQPTATVIGSRFDEVIQMGKKTLSGPSFHVFGTSDILGAELAGALKNIIALGSGILRGVGLGKNMQAMLINRGLIEMIYFGKAMGATPKAFLGTAGMGDLVATATSRNSRNFTFGFRLGSGESKAAIENSMPELAEGVRTLYIAHQLANYYKLRVPVTQMLFQIVFHGLDIRKAIEYLINYPYDVDVDFL